MSTYDEMVKASGIVIGASYLFAYPDEFVTLPGYSSKRGATVEVKGLWPVNDYSPEDGDELAFEVMTADGWRGMAFESELVKGF